MGIHDYYKIVVNKENNNITTIGDLGLRLRPIDLKGKIILIDASYFIHNAVKAFLNPLMDSKGNITAHINTIFNKILSFKKLNIQQIWIFDPIKQTPLKIKEIEKRKKIAENAIEKGDVKNGFRMRTQHINDIKNLLTFMGVPYLQSPEGIEADKFGAFLCYKKKAHYMLSTDSDILAFKGNLLREMKQKTQIYYSAYNYSDILRKLNLTEEQHSLLCVSMGSDFANKVKNFGKGTALKKINNNEVSLTTKEQKNAYNYFNSFNDIIDNIKLEKNNNTLEAVFKKYYFDSKYNKEKLIKFLESYEFNIPRKLKQLENYK